MGREVKRVPLNFKWPVGERWPGYTSFDPCPGCKACGTIEQCETCCGDMVVRRRVEPPCGSGWQLWETTSEGSPISPVCRTSEELAVWCAEHASLFGHIRSSVEDWRKFIAGMGYEMNLNTGAIKWTGPAYRRTVRKGGAK